MSGGPTAPAIPVAAGAFVGAVARAAAMAQLRAEPEWAAALRQSGLDRFLATGLPSTRHEEWRFTPLHGLTTASLDTVSVPGLPSASTVDGFDLGTDGPRVVLVDGRFSCELSRLDLPRGVRAMSLAEAATAAEPSARDHLAQLAPPAETPFTALNAALWQDGLFLRVERGVHLERPLHLVHIVTPAGSNAMIAPRVLILVDAGASATLVESFEASGGERYLTDTVAEIVLAPDARLEHVRVQREASDAWHAGFTAVSQGRDSHFRSFVLSLGARWFRHNLHVRHGGTNVETLLYGLFLARDEQLADNHTAIFHDQPDCRSWEVYKGVLGDAARGVFNGKVIVQPEAQRTDAKQTNRNLLLSDAARVDTKPQLEIFADDVKCTHGATVGRLDEQQRFYLRTRGIAGRTAQALLIWAFAAEVLAEVTDARVRENLESAVHRRLDQMIA